MKMQVFRKYQNSIKTYIENKKNSTSNDSLSIIGHSRLVTNGYQSENKNFDKSIGDDFKDGKISYPIISRTP